MTRSSEERKSFADAPIFRWKNKVFLKKVQREGNESNEFIHNKKMPITIFIDKKYAMRFAGKIGEQSQYMGSILAVGISYDKNSKKHSCKVVELN